MHTPIRNTMPHHDPGGRLLFGATWLAAVAAACLLCSCGSAADVPAPGAETGIAASAPSSAPRGRDAAFALLGDPSVRVVVIDVDVLGSPEAALQSAVQQRSAQSNAECVVYLVRAHRHADAERVAAALLADGFEWVAPVWAPHARTAQRWR